MAILAHRPRLFVNLEEVARYAPDRALQALYLALPPLVPRAAEALGVTCDGDVGRLIAAAGAA